MSSIQEIARETGFHGHSSHKVAEPRPVRTLPVVDNSVSTQSNVTTSVDCYVFGQYVQRNGKVMEVRQRYTIFVSYSKSTQLQTMQQVRSRVVSDFEAKYGRTFNVTNVSIPELKVPKDEVVKGKKPGEAIEFYHGSDMFRSMTRYERQRFEVGTQKELSRTNIKNIRKRYELRGRRG